MFAFGWEQVALLVPGYLRRFTLAYHLEAVFRETAGATTSLFWLVAITAGVSSLRHGRWSAGSMSWISSRRPSLRKHSSLRGSKQSAPAGVSPS